MFFFRNIPLGLRVASLVAGFYLMDRGGIPAIKYLHAHARGGRVDKSPDEGKKDGE
ncbi:hypothetical protein H2203_006791 [Taxawa tesnikishii (nom. ined.)]|nr:hypothetical protein H2203_006791 [Dothideales sp. JES 119]